MENLIKGNSCAIVVIWDEAGLLPSYMRLYVEKLLEVCNRVIVVFNGKCSDNAQRQIRELGEGRAECLSRDNTGYDFAAYQYGLKHLGLDRLTFYDQIILCNSSCYGPVFSLKDMFNSMSKKNVDFWGITQWIGPSWPTHIQSYFYVFNKSILMSKQFRTYWENLLLVKTRFEAIVCLESRLTRHFESYGFKWSCYLPKEKYYPYSSDCTMDVDSFFGLLKQGMPFIKRKLVFQLSETGKVIDLFAFLRLHGYPIEVITEDLYANKISLTHHLNLSSIKKKPRKRRLLVILKRRLSQEFIYLKVRLRSFFKID